ncbi:GAF domain-containing protein [Alkalihalobacterium alkalinitrilicum]|uniref:GAF domain-containing protein n=1 Tax=Alkalihalobacterium alkalinitrilicum TaxID=427920 RepID=UPI0009957110|nr:GAF domain-containing protein [Alkalihalobacterium alkalinitrilicum]
MNIDILTNLNLRTSSDFSAIAIVDPIHHQIRWRDAVGSINQRYKGMRKMYGSGIIGAVVRHGRLIVIDESVSDAEEKRLQSPIMLAENLYSAIATTIVVNQEAIGGLLVGSRSKRTYLSEDIEYVLEKAKELGLLIENENKSRN